MNLQQLDHLLSLAETGSFSRAAEKSHVTQPALSRSIQALEMELGMRLFDRIGKRNELTPFGSVVVERARRIVMETAELRRSAALLTQGTTGNIRLGLGAAPAAIFSTPLLTHLIRDHPGIRMSVVRGGTATQLQALQERDVDAIVVNHRSVPPSEHWRMELLPLLRSGFLCRRDHPLANEAGLDFQRLAGHPVMSTTLSDEVARVLGEQHVGFAQPERWLHVISEDIPSILDVVSQTDAVFLGVLATAHRQLAAGQLVELPLKRLPGLHAQFAFITLNHRAQAPVLGIVKDFLFDLARVLAQQGGTVTRPVSARDARSDVSQPRRSR